MKLTAKTIQKHLHKGGKIRRKCWQNELYLKQVTPETNKSALLFPNKHGGPELWVPSVRQLLATDWEVIKDNL